MFERPNVTVVVIYGNDMDGVTTHPEVVGQNVDLKEFTDEYQRKHSRCSSLVITIINRDKPSPWMVGSKAGPGRSMEVRYGNTK
jgi:hypothetical protein